MQKHFLSAVFLLSSSLFAQEQSFTTQMIQRHDLVDQNAVLDCFYYNPKEFKLVVPKSQTYFNGSTLTRDFSAQNLNDEMGFKFEVYKENGEVFRQITFANGETQKFSMPDAENGGRGSNRQFYVRLSENNTNFNSQYEPSTMYCSIKFAIEKEYSLNSEKMHIDVHPHSNYDRYYVLRNQDNSYLNNNEYKTLILLEDRTLDGGYLKGDYVNLSNYLEEKVVPNFKMNPFPTYLEEAQDADIIVSAFGVNNYVVESDNLDITYTGGNFNFCMFNNTRQVLQAYLRSKQEGQIDLTYDMNEIVAQVNGSVSDIDLSVFDINFKKTNHLKEILSKSKKASNYFKKYFKFYKKKFFKPYSAFYRTIKMKFSSKHYTEEVIMEGAGNRDIDLNFIIVNEK